LEHKFGTVILTSGGEDYWTTVTRQEFYEAMIFGAEGRDGAELAALASALEKSPFQLWMEGAEQRRIDRENALQAAAQVQPPAEVASLRQQLEAFEREMTESLRAAEAEDRERAREAIAQGLGGNAIRAELASMTPAQRNLPALVAPPSLDGPNATGVTMADRDVPGAQRVLAHDLDFWRARRSPVEVRSIAMNYRDYGTCGVENVSKAVLQAHDALDWAALSRLLASPR
jgi:hypothetical protein